MEIHRNTSSHHHHLFHCCCRLHNRRGRENPHTTHTHTHIPHRHTKQQKQSDRRRKTLRNSLYETQSDQNKQCATKSQSAVIQRGGHVFPSATALGFFWRFMSEHVRPSTHTHTHSERRRTQLYTAVTQLHNNNNNSSFGSSFQKFIVKILYSVHVTRKTLISVT